MFATALAPRSAYIAHARNHTFRGVGGGYSPEKLERTTVIPYRRARKPVSLRKELVKCSTQQPPRSGGRAPQVPLRRATQRESRQRPKTPCPSPPLRRPRCLRACSWRSRRAGGSASSQRQRPPGNRTPSL